MPNVSAMVCRTMEDPIRGRKRLAVIVWMVCCWEKAIREPGGSRLHVCASFRWTIRRDSAFLIRAVQEWKLAMARLKEYPHVREVLSSVAQAVERFADRLEIR